MSDDILIDFENPYLQWVFVNQFLPHHEGQLQDIINLIPKWIERYQESEIIEAKEINKQPRPLAVVIGIDEIILCRFYRSSWNEFKIYDYFPPTIAPYFPLYHRALELLQTLKQSNVEVYFTTRMTNVLENFRYLKLDDLFSTSYLESHLIYIPSNATWRYKEEKRKEIFEKNKIFLNVGDQISDLGNYGSIQYLIYNPFYQIT